MTGMASVVVRGGVLAAGPIALSGCATLNENARHEARSGRSHANSCPADLRVEFEDARRVAKAERDGDWYLTRSGARG